MSSPLAQIATAMRQARELLREGGRGHTFPFVAGLVRSPNVGVCRADKGVFEFLLAGGGIVTSVLTGHVSAVALPDFSCVPEGPGGRSAKIEAV